MENQPLYQADYPAGVLQNLTPYQTQVLKEYDKQFEACQTTEEFDKLFSEHMLNFGENIADFNRDNLSTADEVDEDDNVNLEERQQAFDSETVKHQVFYYLPDFCYFRKVTFNGNEVNDLALAIAVIADEEDEFSNGE